MKRINYKSSILFMILTILVLGCNKINDDSGQLISQDLVPDQETAIKIAEAIWLPRFGENIRKYKPYSAELVNDSVWVVQGTLKEDRLGGVPIIKIKKTNCTILEVYHSE